MFPVETATSGYLTHYAQPKTLILSSSLPNLLGFRIPVYMRAPEGAKPKVLRQRQNTVEKA